LTLGENVRKERETFFQGKKSMNKVCWKDVYVEFSSKGLEAVKALNVSRHVLLRAVEEMKSRGIQTEALEKEFEIHRKQQGPRPPRAGESRTYLVQSIGDTGKHFVRVPVIEEKDKVQIFFTDNGFYAKFD
jgi:hypothetical protein